MKVDFNIALKNFKGEELKTPEGATVIVKDIVCRILSDITDAPKEQKLALSNLAANIWISNGEMEITPEECVQIRKYIEHLPATMYAQILSLLG